MPGFKEPRGVSGGGSSSLQLGPEEGTLRTQAVVWSLVSASGKKKPHFSPKGGIFQLDSTKNLAGLIRETPLPKTNSPKW